MKPSCKKLMRGSKAIKSSIILILLIFAFSGCATKGVEVDMPDYTELAKLAGVTASFLPLQNNPKYIPIVELALRGALETIEEEDLNLLKFASDIVEWGLEFSDKPDFEKYAKPIALALAQFRNYVQITIDIPDKWDETRGIIRAFLQGAMEGLRMAKGEVK